MLLDGPQSYSGVHSESRAGAADHEAYMGERVWAGARRVLQPREPAQRCRGRGELRAAAPGHPHGLRVDCDVFVNAARPEQGKTYQPADVDLRLKPNAKAVDAGCVLPTVTDGYSGKAPDMGCHEVGAPLPHYGPRPYRWPSGLDGVVGM